MKSELFDAISQIEKNKGIPEEVLFESIEAALITAYKKNFGAGKNVKIDLDKENGYIKIFEVNVVVEEVTNTSTEISLEKAREVNSIYEIGDTVEYEVAPKNFGRIAALAAKQVIVQRIREAERDVVFDTYSNRESEIVNGKIHRLSKGTVYIDLGKAEALLMPNEQIASEEYRPGDRIKTYITEVKKTSKAPQILVSRVNMGLVRRLFEMEVPEIFDGLVEIKSISREPGMRSKIAVYSSDENIDPVGSCVGKNGSRVQNVVDELNGEKIDIIEWSEDEKVFIANSLSPSKVEEVHIEKSKRSAVVIVPDYQLSLAIGREGQNARLAAKLTNYKIDIKSVSQYKELHPDEEEQE